MASVDIEALNAQIQADSEVIQRIRKETAKVIVGQEYMVDRLLLGLLSKGHILLEGLPGLAKTLLVNAVAKAVDLRFSRIQFTIDMLPSDVIGAEVLDQKSGEFRVRQGPVFANLLLADEINRAAPKAQSAMLEAMQERKVTIGSTTFALPTPFLVIATQNPIEQAGTFELPEAQLDRFMLYHRLDYPSLDQEQDILRRQLSMGLNKADGGAVPRSAFDMINQQPCVSIEHLVSAMEAVQNVFVSEVFLKHSVELIRRTRESPLLDFGCSPRASIALVNASRARAYLHGRDFVVPEDLFELAEDVVLHRIRLTYEAAAEGHNGRELLESMLSDVS